MDYPPLAQNYHFKDLVPHTQDSNLRWKNIVKSHLNAMCGKEDPVVNAIIDSNGSAILYVKDIDSQVRVCVYRLYVCLLYLVVLCSTAIDKLTIKL